MWIWTVFCVPLQTSNQCFAVVSYSKTMTNEVNAMTRILTTIILLLLASGAFCGERETIRDATGKVVGTATTDGNRTVYRDATGKTTGTATTGGNRTIYRDATGKTVGTGFRIRSKTVRNGFRY